MTEYRVVPADQTSQLFGGTYLVQCKPDDWSKWFTQHTCETEAEANNLKRMLEKSTKHVDTKD